MDTIRVRFAPSPTGALHIGGVRTALYNYLFAKKYNGSFILRIEDTDRTRFVAEAEQYIVDTLEWLGLIPDESPNKPGQYGPYRQSERKDLYITYAQDLLDKGLAYYAFDTTDELDAYREEAKAQGKSHFKYDSSTRIGLNNSLCLGPEKTKNLIDAGTPYAIRLKIEPRKIIHIHDDIRGLVEISTDELDDKVILKADGMPTYHLANVVDDYLMKITHVIRGEEWLPSTAHHILLYQYLGWEEHIPHFAHLPLILKPSGKGKLSKRDGQQLGIPVFPLAWKTEDDNFSGFRDLGFNAAALVNFLAFLGWNPGNDSEILSMPELLQQFSFHGIGKSGARFDYEKALWYNQQYILQESREQLLEKVYPFSAHLRQSDRPKNELIEIVSLFQERLATYADFDSAASYFFESDFEMNTKVLKKKYKKDRENLYLSLLTKLKELSPYEPEAIKQSVENILEEYNAKYGDLLPVLRLFTTGRSGGPDLFQTLALLGKEETCNRFKTSLTKIEDYLL